MTPKELTEIMLSSIEEELQQSVSLARNNETDLLHHMLSYHMGWAGAEAEAEARGKRIRPLLLLLTCSAAGGDWKKALPASAAVELVHNFSLIHDDIQDNSPLRRGRTTLWKEWGIAQALNAGDAMFTLAHLALLRLDEQSSPGIVIKAARILQNACLQLTQGQYLDLDYETRKDLSIDDYWPMVKTKTAALLAACTELGALVACSSEVCQKQYRQFGISLGLAFQVQDDLLGIWGDGMVTGKSAESDLVSGKKSLPVLYGINQRGKFYKRWTQGPFKPEEVSDLAALLETEGARRYTEEKANHLTAEALLTLDQVKPVGLAGETLKSLAVKLLKRKS